MERIEWSIKYLAFFLYVMPRILGMASPCGLMSSLVVAVTALYIS
jgi:hypothetical protein